MKALNVALLVTFAYGLVNYLFMRAILVKLAGVLERLLWYL